MCDMKMKSRYLCDVKLIYSPRLEHIIETLATCFGDLRYK